MGGSHNRLRGFGVSLPRIALVLLALGASAVSAPALRAQEVQVPLDERGRVQEVDARLARQLGLFLDRYPDLQAVRLFQVADTAFVLEITLQREGRLVRERQPLSGEEVAELRRQVSERLAERAPQAALDQEGRYLLLGQTALLGLLFYAPAMVIATDADGATALGLYLLTAGGAFFLPYVMTQREPVTYGMANLGRYGASRGIVHGLALHTLIAGEQRHELECDVYGCYEVTEEGWERRQATVALLTSAAGGIAGHYWARSEQMSSGTANTIANGGDLGLLWGVGLASLGRDEVDERLAAGLALAGAGAGIAAGRQLAARRDYTWGDAEIMYTAGFLGALTGAMVTDWSGTDNHRPYVVAAMLGSAVGGVISDRLVRGRTFSVGQSVLNRLGTYAGGLAGLGVAAIVSGEEPDGTILLTSTTLGALAGFAATYYTLAPAAGQRPREDLSSWRVQLSPLALAGRGGGSPAASAPLVTVQYRW